MDFSSLFQAFLNLIASFAVLKIHVPFEFSMTAKAKEAYRNGAIGSNSDAQTLEFEINVNIAQTSSNLHHFWESTGFCPPLPHQASCEWFSSRDMSQNLALIGSLPQGAIKQVRIHYLLDAITITRFTDEKPVYNYTCLDQLLGTLWQNGLQPGFELMGNPSNFYNDFENKTQVYLWKELISELAKRYIDQFGLGYVAEWNFESWNEPKHKRFDQPLVFTIKGFLNYYDACSEGLLAASLLLKLGAPGGACKGDGHSSQYCWSLLHHIQNGTNYFTGQKGIRVNYLSMHRKGEEPDNSFIVMQREMDFIQKTREQLPRLANVTLFNDEADPLVGWSSPRWWRADSTYAAMATKIIAQHQNMWLSRKNNSINYQLLSNDNGFLSYQPNEFTQRTLLARFQMNITRPYHVQMIRKPIYSAMGLLSLLGSTQLEATVKNGVQEVGANFSVGTMASVHVPESGSRQDSWQVGVVVYNSRDTHTEEQPADLIKLSLNNMPQNYTDLYYVIYQLDNTHGNPYAIWKDAGSPRQPKLSVLKAMRENEEPVRIRGPEPLRADSIGRSGRSYQWSLPLPCPGLVLLHICDRAQLQPDQVTNLMVYNITQNQVLITWSDHCVNTKCIKTMELEFSANDRKGPFVRINKMDTIFNSFVYSFDIYRDELVRGFYRARAVDYWGRPGAYSMVVPYGG